MFLIEFTFILLSLCIIFQVNTKPSLIYTIMLLFIALFMAGIAGFRIDSPDYENYYLYFNMLSKGIDYRQINIVAPDPAFALLNICLSRLSTNPLILFLFFGITSVLINAFCFKKYVKYFMISMLFYLVHTYVARELMQIRAGLACALCLFSLRYIVNKCPWRFLITIILASSFHLGAVVFLIAYPLGQYKFNSKKVAIAIICALIISSIFPLGAFFKSLPSYAFLNRIQYYNDTEYGQSSSLFTNVVIIKELLIIIVCLAYRRVLENIPYFNVSFNTYVVSLIWLILWNDFSIVASRIATFYSIGEVLLMAMLPFITKSGGSRNILAVLLILLAGVIMFMNIYTGKWDGVVII
ncbi:TPA: EpsG family protein [Escherichia coli]|nr:EpsG family protein [Escherichia coli]